MTSDVVKVIRDGVVEIRSQDEFPSSRMQRNREYMRDYNARRTANNGGALTIEERENKLYMSEMPHRGFGS